MLSDAPSPDQTRLRSCAEQWELAPRDYSPHQRSHSELQRVGEPITDLFVCPPTIEFPRELFDDAVRLIHYDDHRSHPGSPGITLDTDGQPYRSATFGYERRSIVTARVLYHLNDLTPEISPFRVPPRSHLSLHVEANPYKRYAPHQEQVVVTCRAGSALPLNHRVFHGTLPNVGSSE